MHVQAHSFQHTWLSYGITIAIIVVVMALRMRSMAKMRPLKLEMLWVVPVLYMLIAGLMLWQLPPTGWAAAASVAALVAGAAVGWQRGTMMHIHVDPATHALNQKASPAAMLFLIVIIVIRAGARSILGEAGGITPAMLTDPLIAFALGMLTLTRVEMYIRARRLLEEARGRT